MILIISTCKEPLHELEFVKPVQKILKENNLKFFTKHFKKVRWGHFKNAKKIIITGTSLQDNEFHKYIDSFRWISSTNKPLLGICAGMQMIATAFEYKRQVDELDIKKDHTHIFRQKTEIGYYKEHFTKDFLGIKANSEHEVYHLHNNYTTLPKNFISFTRGSKIPQAIKHKSLPIYGVLFHPEVRNKIIIEKFCKI